MKFINENLTPNELKQHQIHRISIQKERSSSFDSTKYCSENNSMNLQQSWSKTVDMKIPGENKEINFSFENEFDLNNLNKNNLNNLNNNNQQKKQHGLYQMTEMNDSLN